MTAFSENKTGGYSFMYRTFPGLNKNNKKGFEIVGYFLKAL